MDWCLCCVDGMGSGQGRGGQERAALAFPRTSPATRLPTHRISGLGPTLEFYTLLSHELQRASLGIWRHDARAPGAAAGSAASALVAAAKQEAAATAAADGQAGAGAGGGAGPGPLAGELEEEQVRPTQTPATCCWFALMQLWACRSADQHHQHPVPCHIPLQGQHEGVRARDLVVAPQGLFPAPLPPSQRGEDSKVRGWRGGGVRQAGVRRRVHL